MQEIAVVESTQLGLEAVLSAVFDTSMESIINSNEQIKFQLRSIFDGWFSFTMLLPRLLF
jgi:hypothetical protein